jgi:hypothetical protein
MRVAPLVIGRLRNSKRPFNSGHPKIRNSQFAIRNSLLAPYCHYSLILFSILVMKGLNQCKKVS